MPLDASSNSGNYTSSANVQGYWRFGEAGDTTAYDLSGNGYHGAISDATYSSPGADAAAPTMTITATEGADGFTSNDATLALTFTSSEATNNFAVEDITVTNGELSSFSATSSTVYTATFTPAADGAVTIDVGAAGFTDAAGNDNTAATQFNWTYNGTPSAPTALIATPGNTQVVLTWAANSEGDLASYKVYGGTSASPTTLLSTITVGTETSTQSSLTNGTLYYFNISAVDDSGYESDVTSDVSTLPHDPSGNYSLRFDGNDDRVDFGDIDALNTPTKMTVSFWFNRSVDIDTNSNHNTSNVMYAKASDSYNDNIEIGTDGTKVEIYVDSDDDDEANDYDAGIQDSTWYHLAFTYNTADTYGKEGRLYINGSNVAEWGNWGGALDDASGSPVTIGDTDHGTTPFNGSMDEVAIWDEALTSAEITALYNSGMPLDASSNSGNYTSSENVLGYWRFGENSGTTAYDLSGKGNRGIIDGAIYSSPGADALDPTITITATNGSNAVSDGSTTNDSTLTVTFTSSEATTDFVKADDITVTNGILGSLSDTSSTVYTATFTPTADGAVTIDVGASAFTDAAGNNNTAATQFKTGLMMVQGLR